MTTLPPTIERGIATAGPNDVLDAEPDLCQPAAAVVPATPWRPGSGARPGRDEVTVIGHSPVGTTAERAVSFVQYLASLPSGSAKHAASPSTHAAATALTPRADASRPAEDPPDLAGRYQIQRIIRGGPASARRS